MMTPGMLAKLRRSLIQHEGYEKFPYIDTVGKITIGIGYNLTDRGMDDDWINKEYIKDVAYFYHQLSQYSWYLDLNPDRQIILIDMAFMGWKRFIEFEDMIKALEQGDYVTASKEMLQSKWAEQTKRRAETLAQGMLTGEYNI